MAFTGKVALVTGGASGMGRMSSIRLAKQGAKVAALDMNEEALKALSKQYDNITSYTCDVSNFEQVSEVVNKIKTDIGPIDRLTHAAAIMPLSLLAEMPIDKVVQLMRINYEGTVYLSRAVLPDMLSRGRGDLIMFGSIAGDLPIPFAGAYCATKAATNAYAKQLIKESKDSGVRILLICPPPVNTPMLEPENMGMDLDMRLAKKLGLIVEPDFILDSIESGLDAGKSVVYPGLFAKISVVFNRIAPDLFWSFSLKSSKGAKPKLASS